MFIFFGELFLSLNWAVLADILLVSLEGAFRNKNLIFETNVLFCIVLLQYVVIPTRRASAEALQITFGHLLGDAGSSYLLGAVRKSSTL